MGSSNNSKYKRETGEKSCIKNNTEESFRRIPICVLKAQLNNLGLHRKMSRLENSSDLYSCPAPPAYQAFYLLSLHKSLILGSIHAALSPHSWWRSVCPLHPLPSARNSNTRLALKVLSNQERNVSISYLLSCLRLFPTILSALFITAAIFRDFFPFFPPRTCFPFSSFHYLVCFPIAIWKKNSGFNFMSLEDASQLTRASVKLCSVLVYMQRK